VDRKTVCRVRACDVKNAGMRRSPRIVPAKTPGVSSCEHDGNDNGPPWLESASLSRRDYRYPIDNFDSRKLTDKEAIIEGAQIPWWLQSASGSSQRRRGEAQATAKNLSKKANTFCHPSCAGSGR
jgi:hypothetical protein